MVDGRRTARRCLLLVLGLALLLRLAGCFGMGFPYSHYPDESNNLNRSVIFYEPGKGFDLNPHWFNKPAFGYYLNFGAFGFYYLFGRLVGTFSSAQAFADSYMFDRGPFLALARILVTLYATLTIWVVYRIVRRLRDRSTGLVAAAMLAVCSGHVEWSGVVKHDALTALLTVLCLAWVVTVQSKGRRRDYVLAGFLCGLGAATKYIPASMAIPVLYAHLTGPHRGRAWRLLAFAAVCAFAGFFIGSPYNVLDATFRGQLLYRFGFAIGMVTEDDTVLSLMWGGLRTFATSGSFGYPLTALAVVGAVVSLRGPRRAVTALPLVTFVSVLLFIVLFSALRPRPNHILALLPLGAMLAATGWVTLVRRFAGARARPLALATAALLLLPVPGFPAWSTGRHLLEVNRPHVRTEALRWVNTHLPAGATLINDTEVLEDLVSTEARMDWIIARLESIGAHHRAALAKLKRDGDDRAFLDRHHRTLLAQNADRLVQHRLRRRAAQRFDGPRFDVLVLLKPWQTEKAAELEAVSGGYNRLWARLPLDHPASSTPVARYRVPADLLPPGTTAERRAAYPVLAAAPAQFLVSSAESWDNYWQPWRRETYPGWAAFYDDLRAHYDWVEINGDGSMTGKRVRIWDLRTRKEKGRLVDSFDR